MKIGTSQSTKRTARMGDPYLSEVISAAENLGYCIEKKKNGDRAYVKYLQLTHATLRRPVYIHLEVGLNASNGQPHRFCLAVATEDFKADLVNESNGVAAPRNPRQASGLFASSNYTGYEPKTEAGSGLGHHYIVHASGGTTSNLAFLLSGLSAGPVGQQ